MDYFIVAIATLSGLYFHWWIFVRIKRWMNRDLALSMAADNPDKQSYMLSKLSEARQLKINKRDLTDWLQNAADQYSATNPSRSSSK